MGDLSHSLVDQAQALNVSEVEEFQRDLDQKRKRKSWKIIVAGSVLVVLAGAVLFQVLQAQKTEAGPDQDSLSPPNSGNTVTSQKLATVNGKVIRWNDVARECMERHGKESLDHMINRLVIQQACDKHGVSVTTNEIDREVIRVAQKFKLDAQAWYRVMSDERGLTRLQYRRDIIWPMLALRKIAGSTIKKPTSDEIQRLFIREYGVRVEARMIMLDNLRRATEVHRMVSENPKEFGRIAQKYSIEPTSRAMGGKIPPIRKFAGNKTIADAAFQLRQGEISPVIQVGPRYIILLCEGRTKPVVDDIKLVEKELYEMANEEKVQTAVAEVFMQLKNNARIDNYVTGVAQGIRQGYSNRTSSGGNARITSGSNRKDGSSYPPSPSSRK